ncbi:hypothetical protein O181_056874 [Austropuccinia psidii MF-1]|uniref:Uncharacterized protein n=1 Tax=Austropuccinia psidii MF-1 TaxID=1389203 RepID=A0A9Q3E9E9_9BASI|nr:hypothetical protein [Austropuccinia psidii MF-1]
MDLFVKEFAVPETPTPDGTSVTGYRQREVARWTNVGGPIPAGVREIYSSSHVLISRINKQGVMKRIRKISDSPTGPDSEGNDELDGEEVELIILLVSHSSSFSTTKPPVKKFHSHIISSTSKNFQPVLSSLPSSIPPPFPKPSTLRPALSLTVRPSPISQH